MTSLIRLRGPEWNHEEELGATSQHLDHSSSGAIVHVSFLEHLKEWKVVKPLLIGFGLMVFQQFSGINAVIFNAAELFKSSSDQTTTSHTTYSELDGAIAVGAIQVLVTLTASLVS